MFEQESILEVILTIVFIKPCKVDELLRLLHVFDASRFSVMDPQFSISMTMLEKVYASITRIEYLCVIIVVGALQLDRLLGASRCTITLDEHSLFETCRGMSGDPVRIAENAVRPIHKFITEDLHMNGTGWNNNHSDRPHGVIVMAWASFIRIMHDISPGFLVSGSEIDNLAARANAMGAMSFILRLTNDILPSWHLSGYSIREQCWKFNFGSIDSVTEDSLMTFINDARGLSNAVRIAKFVVKEFISAIVAAFGSNITSPSSINVLTRVATRSLYFSTSWRGQSAMRRRS